MRTKPGMAHIHLTFSQPQAAAFRLATGNATDCASWPRPTACQKRWQQHSQQNPGIRGHSHLLAKMQSQISIWVAESLNCQLMRCPEFLFQSRAEPKVFKPSHILKVSEKKSGCEHKPLAQPPRNTLLSHPYQKGKGYEATHHETGSRITWNHTFGQSPLRLLRSCFWSVLWNMCSAQTTYSESSSERNKGVS